MFHDITLKCFSLNSDFKSLRLSSSKAANTLWNSGSPEKDIIWLTGENQDLTKLYEILTWNQLPA